MTQPTNLIPLADRPGYHPEDYQENAPETVWENPLDRDQPLHLYVGVTPFLGDAASPRPRYTGERRTGIRTYVIKAHSTRALPSEFDMAIQQYDCLEPECAPRRRYCRDHTHRRVIVGGEAPHLINRGLQHRPVLHPSLDADSAARNQALADARRAQQQATLAAETALIAQHQATLVEQKMNAQLNDNKPQQGAPKGNK